MRIVSPMVTSPAALALESGNFKPPVVLGLVGCVLGSVLFGHIGDMGRSRHIALALSLVVLVADALLMGMLPPKAGRVEGWRHPGRGWWGTLRFFQGLGIGGSWAGLLLLPMELCSSDASRTLTGGLAVTGLSLGTAVANLVGLRIFQGGTLHIRPWVWRACFWAPIAVLLPMAVWAWREANGLRAGACCSRGADYRERLRSSAYDDGEKKRADTWDGELEEGEGYGDDGQVGLGPAKEAALREYTLEKDARRQQQQQQRSVWWCPPVVQLIVCYPVTVVLGMLVMGSYAWGISVLLSGWGALLPGPDSKGRSVMLFTALTTMGLSGCVVLAALLGDRVIDTRRLFVIASLWASIASCSWLWFVGPKSNPLPLVLTYTLTLGPAIGLLQGCLPSLLAGKFHPSIRYTSMGLCFHGCRLIFEGSFPTVVRALLLSSRHATIKFLRAQDRVNVVYVAVCVLLLGVVSALCAMRMERYMPSPLFCRGLLVSEAISAGRSGIETEDEDAVSSRGGSRSVDYRSAEGRYNGAGATVEGALSRSANGVCSERRHGRRGGGNGYEDGEWRKAGRWR